MNETPDRKRSYAILPATRVLVAIAAVYFISSLVQLPISDRQLSGVPHLRIGRGAITWPMVLSGDSPHYLVIVNSIIEDGDLDLANNYSQAAAGGFQAGARFRGAPVDHHTEVDSAGRERSLHSVFLPLLLSLFVWPLRGTPWVEPVCICLTIAATLLALGLFARRSGRAIGWVAVLAIATPLWCYSRDLWTEPWLAAMWIGVLFVENPAALFALGAMGTLIKYDFVVVPVSLALVFWLRGERRRAYLLAGSGVLGILVAVATAQYLFAHVDHFNLFHLGAHYHAADATLRQKIVPLKFPPSGLAGMFLHPEAGLLPFFPYLVWGFWQLRKGGRLFFPVVVFVLVLGCYPGWHSGTGFSNRYLVPALPALVLAVADTKPRGYLFGILLGYGAFWGMLAGILPAGVYDCTPIQAVSKILERLFALLPQ